MLTAVTPSVKSLPVNIDERRSHGRSGEKNPFSQDFARPPAAPLARLELQSYRSESFALSFTNKDGDTVSLSMEHVEYRQALLQVSPNGQDEGQQGSWGRIVAQIREEYQQLKQDVIEEFVAGLTGRTTSAKDAANGAERSPQAEGIAGLPEYWNAENTSQRIVDFATSFLGAFEGAGEEFVAMIRAAIEDGFSQARDLMGELPEAVGRLVDDTYGLVMQKLDTWAEAQGLAPQTPAQEDRQAPAA